jgi:hypothetical protein
LLFAGSLGGGLGVSGFLITRDNQVTALALLAGNLIKSGTAHNLGLEVGADDQTRSDGEHARNVLGAREGLLCNAAPGLVLGLVAASRAHDEAVATADDAASLVLVLARHAFAATALTLVTAARGLAHASDTLREGAVQRLNGTASSLKHDGVSVLDFHGLCDGNGTTGLVVTVVEVHGLLPRRVEHGLVRHFLGINELLFSRGGH